VCAFLNELNTVPVLTVGGGEIRLKLHAAAEAVIYPLSLPEKKYNDVTEQLA